MTMPAGEYYVGDLCYVMHDAWQEVCDNMFEAEKVSDGYRAPAVYGEFTLADGRRYALYPTYFGDGQYQDQQGRSYAVDSGTIGCILLSDLDSEEEANAKASLGNLVRFDRDFDTSEESGLIRIGDVHIETFEDSVLWDEDPERG